MASFLEAHKIVESQESSGKVKYTNDPDDAGGETYKGWARKKNPLWDGWKLIDKHKKDKKNFPENLESDEELQKRVYKGYIRNYWMPIWGDKIKHQDTANQMYSIAVNFGVKRAIQMKEEANDLRKSGIMSMDLLNKLNEMS